MNKQYKIRTKTIYFPLHRSARVNEVFLGIKPSVEPLAKLPILRSIDIYKYMIDHVYYEHEIEHREFFYVLCLNRFNHTIGFIELSAGGTVSVTVDTKVLFQYALLCNATSIILSHNHPSGRKAPSGTDLGFTKQIKEGAKVFDMILLDHLIVTKDSYYSFADEGTL